MALLTNLIRGIPPTFPVGYCADNSQQLANDIIGGTQFVLLIQQGNFIYNYGSVTPAPENRVFPWLYSVDNLWYTFQSGVWTSAYPVPAGPNGVRWIWLEDSSDLATFDGGDGASPATLTTGAFWEVDTDFQAKFPVGVGTFANAGAITVGGEGGADQHTLTQAELPAVNLPLAVKSGQVDNLDNDTEEVLCNPQNTSVGTNPVTLQVPLGGSGTPFTSLPPYLGVYFIKRTIRQWKTLPA